MGEEKGIQEKPEGSEISYCKEASVFVYLLIPSFFLPSFFSLFLSVSLSSFFLSFFPFFHNCNPVPPGMRHRDSSITAFFSRISLSSSTQFLKMCFLDPKHQNHLGNL